MNNEIARQETQAVQAQHSAPSAELMEKVLLQGNLSVLSPSERLQYYNAVCQSVGLNPLTRPFDYLNLNSKLVLYAKKECTEQLRMIHNVSVLIVARESVEGCYVVTARAVLPSNRQDESLGAVPIEGLKGEARSNAMMKAETKAKRRVTLAICGLGFLDESEVDSIKGATQVVVNESGEVVSGTKEAQSEVVRAKLAGEIPLVAPGPPLIDPRIPGWGPPDGYVEPERAPKVSKATGKKIGATLIQIVQAFGDIKKRYQAIGQEGAYYAVLKNHGVEKSNQFQNTDEGVSQARQAYKAMVMDVQELEVAAAKAREAGEGVPECFRLPDAMEQDIGYRLWLKTRDGSRKIWTVVEAPNADGPDRIWQEVKQ